MVRLFMLPGECRHRSSLNLEMITNVCGNILDTYGEAIVNPVNCKGVMGAGLALQLKLLAPENYRVYREACLNHLLVPGKVLVVPTDQLSEHINFIINFPTKDHWKDPSDPKYIKDGLVDLVKVVKEYGIHCCTIPALGCGLGGLEWINVRKLIISTLKELGAADDPDTIYALYEPYKRKWNNK